MSLYTVNINLQDEKCLVIGGGVIAERKAMKLLESGARLTLISPDITPNLKEQVDQGHVHWIQREYEIGDVKGYLLVIASTDAAAVNTAVYQEARKEHVLVNCVDKPPYCNFYVPSIIQRGDLQIAISTSGSAPFLSKKLRQLLEPKLYAEIAEDLTQLRTLREQFKKEVPADEEDREAFLRSKLEPYIDQIIDKLQSKW